MSSTRSVRARLSGRADERGQVAGALLMVVVTLVAGGLVLFQVGRAADLQGNVVTAADAAALAGATELADQLTDWVDKHGYDKGIPLNEAKMRAAAVDYAQRNGAELVSVSRNGWKVTAVTRTPPEDRLTGSVGGGQGGEASATAEVAYAFAAGSPGTGGARGSGGCRVSDDRLDDLADAVGYEEVPGSSALRRYNGCGTAVGSSPSVAGLVQPMQLAILKIEEHAGRGLNLWTAYRSEAYQRDLCKIVTGPCAPPGRSLHQYGQAIDTPDYRLVAAAIDANPDLSLCQPLPKTDAGHFSLSSGRECAGRQGSNGGRGGSGGAGGAGGAGGFLTTLEVRLIE